MAHLGLRPQAVAVLGGYKAQGRTDSALDQIVRQTEDYQAAGAVSILLEAVPPEVSEAVVERVDIPVIGCGGGPACDGHVVVMHDILKLSPRQPKFAPQIADIGNAIKQAFGKYKEMIESGKYPAAEHVYSMLPSRSEGANTK
jgi:3-methyl-2-oxobutanoate hydroxymethyltransferase